MPAAFDEASYTETPNPSLTDGLTQALRTTSGLPPEHAMIAAQADNPSLAAHHLAGLNLLSGAIDNHMAMQNMQGMQGPQGVKNQNPQIIQNQNAASSWKPFNPDKPNWQNPDEKYRSLIYGMRGMLPLPNNQQEEQKLIDYYKTTNDSGSFTTAKAKAAFNTSLPTDFGDFLGAVTGGLGGAINVVNPFNWYGYAHGLTAGDAWQSGYTGQTGWGEGIGNALGGTIIGTTGWLHNVIHDIPKVAAEFADHPGGVLARFRHDIAADAVLGFHFVPHFSQYFIQTVHDKGWEYAVGEVATYVALALAGGGEGTASTLRTLGGAGKTWADLRGVGTSGENLSLLGRAAHGINDTTSNAYIGWRLFVESRSVAAARYGLKPITGNMRRLGKISTDPGVFTGQMAALTSSSTPEGLDSERWAKTAPDGSWLNPYTGMHAMFGQQLMIMLGLPPESWLTNLGGNIVNLYSAFIIPDPLGAGAQIFTDAKSMEGAQGLLGNLYGGTAVRTADDIDRIYKQYGSFRRMVQLVARSSVSDLAALYKGRLGPEMLQALGKAGTPEEVLNVFKSEVGSINLQSVDQFKLGGYQRAKFEMKENLNRNPDIGKDGNLRRNLLQDRIWGHTTYLSARDLGRSIATNLMQRGFYLTNSEKGIVVDEITNADIASVHFLRDRLYRMGVDSDVLRIVTEQLVAASAADDVETFKNIARAAQANAAPMFIDSLIRDPLLAPVRELLGSMSKKKALEHLGVNTIGLDGSYVSGVDGMRRSRLVDSSGEAVISGAENDTQLATVPVLDPVRMRRAMRVLIRMSKDTALMDLGVAMEIANKTDETAHNIIQALLDESKFVRSHAEEWITSIARSENLSGTTEKLFSKESIEILLNQFRSRGIRANGTQVGLAEQVNMFRRDLMDIANSDSIGERLVDQQMPAMAKAEANFLLAWMDANLTRGYKPDLSQLEEMRQTISERETQLNKSFIKRQDQLLGKKGIDGRRYLKWTDARNFRINASITTDILDHVINDMMFKPATLSTPSWAWHVGLSEAILNSFRYGPLNTFEAHFASRFAQKALKNSLPEGVDQYRVRDAVGALLAGFSKEDLEGLGFTSEEALVGEYEAKRGGFSHGGQFNYYQIKRITDYIQKQVDQDNGGLSIRITTEGEPEFGYMVSLPASHGTIVQNTDFLKSPEQTALIIYNYIQKEAKQFGKDDYYLGLWHDPETGHVHMDVSERVFNKDEAIQLGRDRDQISIVDLEELNYGKKGGTPDYDKMFPSTGGKGAGNVPSTFNQTKISEPLGKGEFTFEKTGVVGVYTEEAPQIGTPVGSRGAKFEGTPVVASVDTKNKTFTISGGTCIEKGNVGEHYPLHSELAEPYKKTKVDRLPAENVKEKMQVAYRRASRVKDGIGMGIRESIVMGLAGEAKAKRLIGDAMDIAMMHPGGIHPALSASHVRYASEMSGAVDEIHTTPQDKTTRMDMPNRKGDTVSRKVRWKTGSFGIYTKGNLGHINALQHYVGSGLKSEYHQFIASTFQKEIATMGEDKFVKELQTAKKSSGQYRDAPVMKRVEAEVENWLRKQPDNWRNQFGRSKRVSEEGFHDFGIKDPIKDWARVSADTNLNAWTSTNRKVLHTPILDQISKSNVETLDWYKRYAERQGVANMPDQIPAPSLISSRGENFLQNIQRLSGLSHEKMLGPMVDYLSRRPAYLLAYHNQMELLRDTVGVFSDTAAKHMEALRTYESSVLDRIAKLDPEGTLSAAIKQVHDSETEFYRLITEGNQIFNTHVTNAVHEAMRMETFTMIQDHVNELDKQLEDITRQMSDNKVYEKVMDHIETRKAVESAISDLGNIIIEHNFALAEYQKALDIAREATGVTPPIYANHLEDWQFHSNSDYSISTVNDDAERKGAIRRMMLLGSDDPWGRPIPPMFEPNPIKNELLVGPGLGLTKDQKEAIGSYTAYDYLPINEYLRLSAQARSKIRTEIVDTKRMHHTPYLTYEKIVKALDETIDMVTLKKPLTVFRGVSHTKFQPNTIVPEPGYTSTSIDFDAAHYFAFKNESDFGTTVEATRPTMFEIQLSPGQKCWPRNSEGELTLPRGSALYIHKVQYDVHPSDVYPDFYDADGARGDGRIDHVVATVIDAKTARQLNGRLAPKEQRDLVDLTSKKVLEVRKRLAAKQTEIYGTPQVTLATNVATPVEQAVDEIANKVGTYNKLIKTIARSEDDLWNPDRLFIDRHGDETTVGKLKVDDAFTQNLWRKSADASSRLDRWVPIDEMMKYVYEYPTSSSWEFATSEAANLQEAKETVDSIFEKGFRNGIDLHFHEGPKTARFRQLESAIIKELKARGVTAIPIYMQRTTESEDRAAKWMSIKDTEFTDLGQKPNLDIKLARELQRARKKKVNLEAELLGSKKYKAKNLTAAAAAAEQKLADTKDANEELQALFDSHMEDKKTETLRMVDTMFKEPPRPHVGEEMAAEYAAAHPSVARFHDQWTSNQKNLYGSDWMGDIHTMPDPDSAWGRFENSRANFLWGQETSAGEAKVLEELKSELLHTREQLNRHVVQPGMVHEAQAQTLAETRAAQKMIGEVHNPADKMNFEYAMRVVAPFYFAQNQAWRRAFRLLAENPAAFEKYLKLTLAMTNSAQTHDQNGVPSITVPSSQFVGRNMFNTDMSFGTDLSSLNTLTPFGMTGKGAGLPAIMEHALKPEFGPLMTIPLKWIQGVMDSAAYGAGGADAAMPIHNATNWLMGDIASKQPYMAQLIPMTFVRQGVQMAVDGHFGLGKSPDAADDPFGNGYASLRLQQWKSVTQDELNATGQILDTKGFGQYSAKQLREWKVTDPGFYTLCEQMTWAMKTHNDSRYLQDIANRVNRDTTMMWMFKMVTGFFGPTQISFQSTGLQLNQQLRQDIDNLGITDGYAKFSKDNPHDSMTQVILSTSPYGVTYPSTEASLKFINENPGFVMDHPELAAFFMPRPKDAAYSEAAHAVEMDMNLRGRQTMAGLAKTALIAWGNNWYYNHTMAYADATWGKDMSADKSSYLSQSMKQYSQYNPTWYMYHNTERKTIAQDAYRKLTEFATSGPMYSYKASTAGKDWSVAQLPESVKSMDKETQDTIYYAIQMMYAYQSYIKAYNDSTVHTGMSQEWYDYCQSMIKEIPSLAPIANSVFIHLPSGGVTNG